MSRAELASNWVCFKPSPAGLKCPDNLSKSYLRLFALGAIGFVWKSVWAKPHAYRFNGLFHSSNHQLIYPFPHLLAYTGIRPVRVGIDRSLSKTSLSKMALCTSYQGPGRNQAESAFSVIREDSIEGWGGGRGRISVKNPDAGLTKLGVPNYHGADWVSIGDNCGYKAGRKTQRLSGRLP